jgi:hypothetical protein
MDYIGIRIKVKFGSNAKGVDLKLMGFELCKVGRPSGIRY